MVRQSLLCLCYVTLSHCAAVAGVAAVVAALPRLSVPFLSAEIKHKFSFNIVITNIFKDA